MPSPTFNPNLPADHSPLSAAEMLNQFQGIQDNLDVMRQQLKSVQPLYLSVSNPPTSCRGRAGVGPEWPLDKA